MNFSKAYRTTHDSVKVEEVNKELELRIHLKYYRGLEAINSYCNHKWERNNTMGRESYC
jgi:hypothetical protein